jgi:UDP-N-acetylglucosamine acyltransferase
MATGNPASAHGINSEGLKRRGFSEAQVSVLRRAYKMLYKSGNTLSQAMALLNDPAALGADTSDHEKVVRPLLAFLESATRGIVR